MKETFCQGLLSEIGVRHEQLAETRLCESSVYDKIAYYAARRT